MLGLQLPGADLRALPDSASTAAAIVVTLGFKPAYVVYISNHGGTNPDIYIAFSSDIIADKVLKITGTTGVVTNVTNANSISFQENGITIAAAAQTNSGKNTIAATRGS